MLATRHLRSGLLILGIAVSPAAAQKQYFNPSIDIGQGYNSNVAFTGPSDQGTSDTITNLGFTLPYERESRRSHLRLRGRSTFLRYNDFEALDNNDHRLDQDWNWEASRRSRLRIRSSFWRTQQQGSPPEDFDPDLNLTPRTERDTGQFAIRFAREEGQRWGWNIRGAARMLSYEAIAGVPDNTGVPEDRDTYGAAIAGNRRVNRTSTVGLRYEFEHFNLEQSGEEDSNQLAVTYGIRIARRLNLEAAVGGYRNTGLAAGADRSGVLAELFVTRSYQRLQLQLNLFHRPSAGGSLRGTAEQSSLGLTFRSTDGRRRPWVWRVTPRLARRTPSDPTGETVESYGLRGNVERRMTYRFGLRLDADWFDQSNDDSVLRANLAFRYYPIGESRLGGRRR